MGEELGTFGEIKLCVNTQSSSSSWLITESRFCLFAKVLSIPFCCSEEEHWSSKKKG